MARSKTLMRDSVLSHTEGNSAMDKTGSHNNTLSRSHFRSKTTMKLIPTLTTHFQNELTARKN